MVNNKIGQMNNMQPQYAAAAAAAPHFQAQQQQPSKVAYFYRDGDQHFAPFRVVINRRKYGNLASLMSDLGERAKLPRGVRAIFTPRGQDRIENIDQIENEASYICSSNTDRLIGLDVNQMRVEPHPFVATKAPPDYAREDSRFIRTGLLTHEPSDDDLTDLKSRLRRQQDRQKLERLQLEEKKRGKDAHWAERVRRVVLVRNGEPDLVKHYSLTTSTATNMLKVKADLSAMFGMPVERIYTVDGRLVLDVEDMFRDESVAFVVSFGEHFKPMTGYMKYASANERDLARLAKNEKETKDKPVANKSFIKPEEPLRRFDTVILPPLEKSTTAPKSVLSEPARKRPAVLPPLSQHNQKVSRRSKEAPETARPAPLTPAYDLPPPVRLRSKTMDSERPRKVQFANDGTTPSTTPIGKMSRDNTTTISHTRRSRLGQSMNAASELVPVVPHAVVPGLKPSDRKKSKSDIALNNDKNKLQRSRSEILADVQNFSNKATASLKKDNKAKPEKDQQPKLNSFVKLRKTDRMAEPSMHVWEIRITTGDLPAGVSTASIILTVYGVRGKSNPINFTPAKKVFMPRSVEHLTARIPNIGEVYKLRIESNCAAPNPDWRCDTVVMENGQTGERLEFPCKRWLSENYDDKQTVREIPALSESKPPIPLISYDVIVHTGNVWNAATLGTVSLEVFGERGDTGRRALRHSNHGAPFAKGQVDIFPLECVSLGDVRYIKVRHEPGAHAIGWYVENLVLRVREFDLHSQFIFPLSRWLSTHEDDGLLEVEVRPVDLANYMRLQDTNMWPLERWKFTLPDTELMFYSCNAKKPLRITSGGFIDARSEAVDISAVFTVANGENFGRENSVALLSTSNRSSAYIAFSQRRVVARNEYSASCDLRVHVLPSRAINLESEKFPHNYVSVLSTGQLHPESETAMPGPAQAFFCYVKGCFRDGGILMLCSSKIQTLCIEKDPSLMTALGKRNRLAYFRVHKVSSGGIRKFESVVFSGSYLQIRRGVCNAAGNGDRYCEFKVKRNREQNFVTLESLRERGCFVGFTNTGSVYPLVDQSSSHPNCILFPEVIEFGRRKGGPFRRDEDYEDNDRESRSDNKRNQFRVEQPMHKPHQLRSTYSNNNNSNDQSQNGERSGEEDAPAARRRRPQSPYKSQVSKSNNSNLRVKPKPKTVDKNRFQELSKPAARVTNANRPPTPKKTPKKAPPPPRVANLPPKRQQPPPKKENNEEDEQKKKTPKKEPRKKKEAEEEEDEEEEEEEGEGEEEDDDDEEEEKDKKKQKPAADKGKPNDDKSKPPPPKKPEPPKKEAPKPKAPPAKPSVRDESKKPEAKKEPPKSEAKKEPPKSEAKKPAPKKEENDKKAPPKPAPAKETPKKADNAEKKGPAPAKGAAKKGDDQKSDVTKSKDAKSDMSKSNKDAKSDMSKGGKDKGKPAGKPGAKAGGDKKGVKFEEKEAKEEEKEEEEEPQPEPEKKEGAEDKKNCVIS